MAKGFGSQPTKENPIARAAEILHYSARHVNKPLVIPMLPPDNERGLNPGEIEAGSSELPPSCDGLVIAIQCSADEAQSLLDLVMAWEHQRMGGDRDA
jgi:hypothetical protein